MKSLTMKQRTKVNAVLSIIHARSPTIKAQEVIDMARTYVGMGHTEREAYQLSINAWASVEPQLASTVGAITGLIEASDDQTVARYDEALNAYIADGNEAGLNALAPMMAEDGQAYAQSNGEDLASGDHPFAALAALYPSTGPQAPIPVALNTPANVAVPSNTQLSASAAAEGTMSARTAQRWAEAPIMGVSGGRDPFAGMTPQAAYLAARSMPMGGQVILPTVAPVVPATF